ncbi:MAG: nucleotidyltransferase family protein [Candidatus Bathyarchaeia archaeon]
MVLSGGPGTRLKPLTDNVPKGLVIVGGKALLDWILEWLSDSGVRRVVMGVAHLKEKIMDHVGDGSKYGLEVEYSVHTVEGGTAEGFRLAIQRHVDDEDFFAMNGDQIVDLSLDRLAEFHMAHRPIATIVGGRARCAFGHLLRDDRGNLSGFLEKPLCNHALISTGIYAFNKRILEYMPERGDIEEAVFPELAKRGLAKIFPFEGKFLTVNTLKDLMEANEEMEARPSWRTS